MKRITFFILTIAMTFTAMAQLDIASEGQKMVRTALTDALVLIRQNYVLVNDKQEEYGRAGHEYFGRAYGVGLFTDCGLAMPTSAAEPWRTDKAYDKFRSSNEYIPKISLTELRHAGQSKYTTASLDATSFVYTRDSMMLYTSSINKDASIHSELPEEGEVNGWLVLLTSSGNLETDETAPVTIDAYKYAITFDKKSILYPIEQTSSMRVKNILGGAFFVPTYSTGQITFKYAGILVMKDENWCLKKIDKIFLNCNPSTNPETDSLQKLSSPQENDTVPAKPSEKTDNKKKGTKDADKSNSPKEKNAKPTPTPTKQNIPAEKKEETDELNRVN